MKKKLAAMGALAAIAITMGACGGDDGASVREVGDDGSSSGSSSGSGSGSGSGSAPSGSEVSPSE